MKRLGIRNRARTPISALTAVCLVALMAGCQSTAPDREIRMQRGYVYYLDGAGGGTPWSNWSGGVRRGLMDAGYDGAGEMFTWETGLGVAMDQVASDEYKRGKAEELAKKILQYQVEHPQATVNLIGLSAGTAVAVFTAEALPPNLMIDNVILLSGSLSSTHDLTPTLRRLRGRLYIFTSQNDTVLKLLIPEAGTADRSATTTDTVGIDGARLPAGATSETMRLYRAKVVHIPYNAAFAAYGHYGGHTDSVKGPFVERFVAPLVTTAKATGPLVAAKPARGQVENPDYRRWARFSPGSYVVFDGYQVVDGVRTPVRMKSTLVTRDRNSVLVEREIQNVEISSGEGVIPRRLFVTAAIDPKYHPLTHPQSHVRVTGHETITMKNRNFDCEGKSVTASAEFPDWGKDVSGVVYTTPDIPGGIAQIQIQLQQDGKAVEFSGRTVDFHIVQ